MKIHVADSVTDKVCQYVDNGIFLDGRLKALGVGTQLTDKDAEAHRLCWRDRCTVRVDRRTST